MSEPVRTVASDHAPRRLLVRPRPRMGLETEFALEPEAARSWLSRVAFDNGYSTTRQLLRRLGQVYRSSAAMERLHIGDPLVAALAEATGVPAESIVTLSNSKARQELGADPSMYKVPWVLRGGAAAHPSMVCPACLAEDTVPFWRDHWRLAATVICCRHGDTLIDACPACGAAFALIGRSDESLIECGKCRHSLFKLQPRAIPSIWLPAWLVPPLEKLQQHELPMHVVHPRVWWDGALMLLRVLVSPLRAARLAGDLVPEEFRSVLQRLGRPANPEHFERLPLVERRVLLCLVDWLVQEWPERFVRTMLAAKIRAWDFNAVMGVRCPCWLALVVRERLGSRKYVYTEREASQAVQVLAGDGDYVSRLSVKRLLGVHESKSLAGVFPQKLRRLSERQLLELSQRLDAIVAGTPVGREAQSSILRNACTIAVAMWTGVSFSRLVGMPLSSGVAFLAEWSDVVGHAPTSSDEAALAGLFRRWMEEYLHRARPRLLRRFGDPGVLFVTRFGEAHDGNSIPALFTQALRDCGIADWDRGAVLLGAMPVRHRPHARQETVHLRSVERKVAKRQNRVRG